MVVLSRPPRLGATRWAWACTRFRPSRRSWRPSVRAHPYGPLCMPACGPLSRLPFSPSYFLLRLRYHLATRPTDHVTLSRFASCAGLPIKPVGYISPPPSPSRQALPPAAPSPTPSGTRTPSRPSDLPSQEVSAFLRRKTASVQRHKKAAASGGVHGGGSSNSSVVSSHSGASHLRCGNGAYLSRPFHATPPVYSCPADILLSPAFAHAPTPLSTAPRVYIS